MCVGALATLIVPSVQHGLPSTAGCSIDLGHALHIESGKGTHTVVEGLVVEDLTWTASVSCSVWTAWQHLENVRILEHLASNSFHSHVFILRILGDYFGRPLASNAYDRRSVLFTEVLSYHFCLPVR